MEEKVCPKCKNLFVGRLNRKYCSLSCKSEVGNEIARLRRKPLKKTYATICKNSQILKELFDIGVTSINEEKLASFGFSFEVGGEEIVDGGGAKVLYWGDFGITRDSMGFFYSYRILKKKIN